MITDAQANIQEILAQPGNKILDISAIESEYIDNTYYARVLTEAGNSITVIIGPEQDQDSSDTSITNTNPEYESIVYLASTGTYYDITADRFKCHRKQEGVYSGPRTRFTGLL
jgi:hypothetical protein